MTQQDWGRMVHEGTETSTGIWYAGGQIPVDGCVQLSPHTTLRILDAFDRLQKEMGIDYDRLINATPAVVLHALVTQNPAVNRVLPNATDLDTFKGYVKRIETKAGLESLLKILEEPSVEDLSRILSFLRSLPSSLKERHKQADAQIKPSGGPPEKLSDPVEVSAMVDEIFETMKETGKPLGVVQQEFADNYKKEKLSLKTVQRRFREEMERRKSISDWIAERKKDDSSA